MTKEEIIEISEKYIHVRTNEVPEWANSLTVLKAKIKESLINSDSQSDIEGVTFCHPIDVPTSKH